jgi:hypothetical protein
MEFNSEFKGLIENKVLKLFNSPKAASVQQMDVAVVEMTSFRHSTTYLELQLAPLFVFHFTHVSIK